MAMLTVALVTTLASAALWQQWRQVEIEIAERGRSQTAWMMTGALDWTRLILREDAVSAQGTGVDHLREPWALPVQESKLSTFLSQDQQWREGDAEVFLSGQITDAQSRMNVMNLIEDGKVSPKMLARFAALFERLSLPQSELQNLAIQLQAALQAKADNHGRPASASTNTALMPKQTAQLVWLGLSPRTLASLEPHITLLPEATPVNRNRPKCRPACQDWTWPLPAKRWTCASAGIGPAWTPPAKPWAQRAANWTTNNTAFKAVISKSMAACALTMWCNKNSRWCAATASKSAWCGGSEAPNNG
jgi:type II secretory pathway component PulK